MLMSLASFVRSRQGDRTVSRKDEAGAGELKFRRQKKMPIVRGLLSLSQALAGVEAEVCPEFAISGLSFLSIGTIGMCHYVGFGIISQAQW